MSVVIQNARLINPAESLDRVGSMKISDTGIIEAVEFEASLPVSALDTVVEFSHGIVASGLFDMHCHFREPGFEYKETLETGAASAIEGGFTGVALMPNTDPPTDNASVATFIAHRSKKFPVEVEVIGALTVGRLGERIAPYGELFESGVKALSDDGSPVMNSRVMRLALEYASQFDLLVIQHCEDVHLSHGGVMNESVFSSLLGLRGVPSISESIVLSRDLELLRYLRDTKSHAMPVLPRYHVAHISTAKALDLVRLAKRDGLPISCEVAPHHFALTDKAVFESGYDGNFRMNPPLRSEHDRDAVLNAIADGTIDCIATDHAPHACHEKDCGISQAAFGIVGLETSVGLTFTELVHKGLLSPYRAVEMLSSTPRRLMRLPNVSFKAGQPANLTLIDPTYEWTVDTSKLTSKSKNSPFKNFRLRGKAVGIVSKGKVILAQAITHFQTSRG
ncbi:MAG: dihydroorotase [[Candidatus Thermochlorobacteriaceae] bacterium GBChlB]|nr:MAG: dihydroorotase [[Candidatus Thermochlorobacteriaceae] bacterium GBChlB]